jgi:Flp pilus assembly protein CpaB
MSPVSARRGLSPLRAVSFVVVTLVTAGVATVGSMWAMGIPLPFLAHKAAAAPLARKAGIAVLLSARPIPAYTKVTREYLFDAQGEPLVRYLTSEQVKKIGCITDVSQIVDRVLARDKRAGYAFTEKDFFPDGTRPGLVAGIPPGKRAFVLQGDKILGIHGLKAGDHFDLLGTLPVDWDKALARYRTSGMPDPMLAAQDSGSLPKHASVKALVQNGVIVVATTIREVPVGSGGQKGAPRTRPVQEITIALDPREVAPLTEALAVHAEVFCVARSGRPDDLGESSITLGSIARPQVQTLETIVGRKRQMLVFPRPGQGPQEPMSETPSGEEKAARAHPGKHAESVE